MGYINLNDVDFSFSRFCFTVVIDYASIVPLKNIHTCVMLYRLGEFVAKVVRYKLVIMSMKV